MSMIAVKAATVLLATLSAMPAVSLESPSCAITLVRQGGMFDVGAVAGGGDGATVTYRLTVEAYSHGNRSVSIGAGRVVLTARQSALPDRRRIGLNSYGNTEIHVNLLIGPEENPIAVCRRDIDVTQFANAEKG